MENNMEYLLFATGDMRFTKNPIHLNDIQPINTDSNFWKKGDIFLSLRHQSMIILYRPATNKILWKSTGHFYHQHDVDVLDANRISIFNNNSKDFINGDVVDGHNEVVIFNFKTKKYSSYLKKALLKKMLKLYTRAEVRFCLMEISFLKKQIMEEYYFLTQTDR